MKSKLWKQPDVVLSQPSEFKGGWTDAVNGNDENALISLTPQESDRPRLGARGERSSARRLGGTLESDWSPFDPCPVDPRQSVPFKEATMRVPFGAPGGGREQS